MSPRLTPGGLRRLSAVAFACASVVIAALLASVFLRAAVEAWATTAAPGPDSPADGILLVTGLAGTLLTLWLGLGTALSALSALPGALGQLCRELAARVAPAAVRKAVAFVLGTSLTAAFIPGTAVAGVSHETRPRVVSARSMESRTGIAGAVRTRTVSLTEGAPDASFRFVAEPAAVGHESEGASADAAPSPTWSLDGTASNALSEHQVVVLRGDTLWSIASRHLGPEAGPAAIDAEWRRWFARNREIIGEDADQILPGQLLTPPVARHAAGPTRPPASRVTSKLEAGS
jgi:hypothetical protein